MKTNTTLTDLLGAQAAIYNQCGLAYEFVGNASESKEYGACIFKLNALTIHFRVAKVTPTKVGQFVTLWKRSERGPIIPYDAADPFDFVITAAKNNKNSGLFIFPKEALRENGVISLNHKGVKRALRIYAPWDNVDNRQAAQSQRWQQDFFIELEPIPNSAQLKKLLNR